MHQQPITRPRRTTRALTFALVSALVVLAAACLPGADDQPKSGAGAGFGVFHDIRYATHVEDGYDRVVFDFVGALPGWDVRYVPKPVAFLPSGQETTLAGVEAIEVRLSPAGGKWSGSPDAYNGEVRRITGMPEVVELVYLQDFEGVVTWAIGVNHHRAFRVMSDSTRLVIDVATS